MQLPQNSNPRFYQGQIVRDGRPLTLIHSTLDELHVGQSYAGSEYFLRLDFSNDLAINATHLVLHGDVALPGGRVTLVCRQLTVTADAGAATRGCCTIDVSGPLQLPSPYDRALASVGEDGVDGDAVALEVNAGEPRHLPSHIRLAGKGQFAEPGATGGEIVILADEIVFESKLVLRANGGVGFPGCNGTDARGALQPGRGGRGGSGGTGGSIRIGARTCSGMELTQAVTSQLQPGPSGQPGQAGYNPDRKVSGAPALPADPARGGQWTQIAGERVRADIGSAADAAFLYKLYQKARQDYLFAEDSRWKELGQTLSFIADITAAFGDDEKRGPVGYRVNRKIAGLRGYWLRNKNVFGWSQEWVPSTPWETMKAHFEHGQAERSRLFDRVQVLRTLDAAKDNAQHALNEARLAAHQQVAVHQAKADLYADELVGLSERILRARANFGDCKRELDRVLGKLQEDVASHFQCPSVGDLLSAAESVVFTMSNPGEAAAMTAVQLGKIINSGTTQVAGLDKQQIVDEIVDVRSSVKGLADSVRDAGMEDGPDGKPVPRPGQRLVLAKLDSLEDDVRKLAKALGSKAASPVLTAIEAIRSAVIELGQARYLYNTYAVRAFEEGQSAIEAKADLAELDRTPDPQTPEWHAAVALVTGLYQGLIESLAEDVFLLQQKFTYVALTEKQPIHVRDDLDGLWESNSPDPSDLDQWNAKVLTLFKTFTQVQGDKDAALSPFPSDPSKRSDLCIAITEPALIQTLIETGQVLLLPCWYEGDRRQDDPRTTAYPRAYARNASGMSEVRLTHIQPRVYGATTAGGSLRIGIVVAPRTVLLSGEPGSFTAHLFDNHHHRKTSVVQNLAYGPDEPGNADLGTSIDGNLHDDNLDAVGLYAEYIKLSVLESDNAQDDNRGLDRKGIHEIRIYFKGLARST